MKWPVLDLMFHGRWASEKSLRTYLAATAFQLEQGGIPVEVLVYGCEVVKSGLLFRVFCRFGFR